MIRFAREMKNSTGIAAAVFLVLTLYVSTPPLVLKACGYPASPRFQSQLDIFYWPLSEVYDHVPPYRWFIDWQFEMIGLR